MSTEATMSTTHGTTTGREGTWLEGPVSRALALVLLAANLGVMGVMFARQSETLDRLEMSIATQPPVGVAPSVAADPELCWLVGSLAYASGQGENFKTVLGPGATDTSCTTDAMRGAAGVNR